MNDLVVLYSSVTMKCIVLIHYSYHGDDFSLTLRKINKKWKHEAHQEMFPKDKAVSQSQRNAPLMGAGRVAVHLHSWITSYWEWFSKSDHPEGRGFGRGAVIEPQCCNTTCGSKEEKIVSTIPLVKPLLQPLLQLLHVSARNYKDLGNITKISKYL